MDYATWFGWRYDFIHGIQMLPVTPAVLMIRTPKFCQQERHLLGPVFRGTMPKSEQQIPLPAPDPLVSNSSVTSTSLLQKFEKLGPVFLKLMIPLSFWVLCCNSKYLTNYSAKCPLVFLADFPFPLLGAPCPCTCGPKRSGTTCSLIYP